MDNKNELKTGTVVGTTMTILGSIQWLEIEKTLVLGSIGAVVSFLVSFVCKRLLARWDKTGRNDQRGSL